MPDLETLLKLRIKAWVDLAEIVQPSDYERGYLDALTHLARECGVQHNGAPVSEYNAPMAPRPRAHAEPWFDSEEVVGEAPQLAPGFRSILVDALKAIA